MILEVMCLQELGRVLWALESLFDVVFARFCYIAKGHR